MEKTFTYEDQVKIKNLLTSIQKEASELEDIRDSVIRKINDITAILNK